MVFHYILHAVFPLSTTNCPLNLYIVGSASHPSIPFFPFPHVSFLGNIFKNPLKSEKKVCDDFLNVAMSGGHGHVQSWKTLPVLPSHPFAVEV